MSKPAFYAVNKGHTTGVFRTWEECSRNVQGFPGAKYKKFTNQPDAEQFAGVRVEPATDTIPSSPISAVLGVKMATPIASNTPTSTHLTSTIQSPVVRSEKALDTPVSASSSNKKRSPIVLTEMENESACDVVYSDGACKGNGMPGSTAGIGVWWGRNNPRNISERCPGAQTNNRAELIAIARTLETTPISKRPLLIKTDSKYSRDCFDRWIHSWVNNDWRNAAKEPVKNKELIQYIWSLLVSRHNSGQIVHLKYVKGHSGNEGNDGADQLAVEGCGKPALPERDWDAEREIVENLSTTITKAQDEDIDWEMYAEAVLNDDDFMEEMKSL